ncbi:MAG: hypothetical protein ACLGIC_05475 [Acidimicrobiia bacterium]
MERAADDGRAAHVVALRSPPGLADVDELARVCLGLRRLGGRVRVVGPPELLELLVLAGFDEHVELVAVDLACVAAVELIP